MNPSFYKQHIEFIHFGFICSAVTQQTVSKVNDEKLLNKETSNLKKALLYIINPFDYIVSHFDEYVSSQTKLCIYNFIKET